MTQRKAIDEKEANGMSITNCVLKPWTFVTQLQNLCKSFIFCIYFKNKQRQIPLTRNFLLNLNENYSAFKHKPSSFEKIRRHDFYFDSLRLSDWLKSIYFKALLRLSFGWNFL